MAWPRSGRRAGLVLVIVLLAAAPAAAVSGPNPHDHGFVPAFGRNGQLAPLPGSAQPPRHASRASCTNCAQGTPPLNYHDGPVSPSSTVYAIFWDPPAAPNHFDQTYKDLITRYFTDLAAVSGHPTNTNAISQQYTDTAGGGHRASYSVTYGGAFDDTNPYPAAGQCTAPNGDTVCLNDDSTSNHIQNEVTDFVRAHGLPIDLTHIYFVFTPAGVSSCDGANSCSYQAFCAYHRFSDATTVPLYANQPDDALPGCTASSFQQPNNNNADITLNSVAHEHNEIVTDPQGTAWWDANGYEIGDECAYTFGGELGGSSPAQYNQLINGHPYQLQQEYSNAHRACMSSVPLAANFTGTPSAPIASGQMISLDGSSSSEAGGTVASYAWDFGDGSPTVPGASPTTSHSYATAGTYTIKLTVADSNGFSDFQTASVVVSGEEAPSASLSVTTASPIQGQPVSFDGSASSDPDGSISTYSWNFGDGSPTGSGANPSHTFASAGTYTVTLTITDSAGLTAMSSHQVTIAEGPTHQVSVDEPPSARAAVSTSHPASALPVAFDGSRSTDPDGSIRTYRWDFGDGSASGSGVAPKHRYAKPGRYKVTLTVLDSLGLGASTTLTLKIALGGRITNVSTATSSRGRFLLVELNAPGRLSVGPTTVQARRAQRCRFQIRLSRSQQHQLRVRHALTLKIKLRFVPDAGSTTSRTAKLTLRG